VNICDAKKIELVIISRNNFIVTLARVIKSVGSTLGNLSFPI